METNPNSGADDARTPWEENGMTADEWDALSPEARAWRAEHPRVGPDVHREAQPPTDADRLSDAAGVHDVGQMLSAQGAQVVLTGQARNAARGGSHGSIEANTAARDAAIADGHVVPETSDRAVIDTLKGSVGQAGAEVDPAAEAERVAAERRELGDRAKAARPEGRG